MTLSYGEEACELASALAYLLSAGGGLNVWLDSYRLENGFPRGSSVYAAARDAAYVVLLVTPRYLSDPTRCLELLAALRRPPEQVLVW